MLRELLQPLIESEAFQGLLAGTGPRVARADAAGHAYVAAALAEATGSPVLLVVPGPREAERLRDGAALFLGPERAALFPAWEALPVEGISPTPEVAARRSAAAHLARTAKGPLVVVAPVVAAVQRLVPDLGTSEPYVLERGGDLGPDGLAEVLTSMGYERTDLVQHRGEMAVRGGIVDIFPGASTRPVRLEFWGDEIENLREFSPSSQTSTRRLDRAEVHPVRELLPTNEVRDRARRAIPLQRGSARDALDRLSEGLVFEGMERAAPLLFERMPVLADLFEAEPWVVLSQSRRTADRAASALDEARAHADATTGAEGSMADLDEAIGGRPRLDLTELAEGVELGIRGWASVGAAGPQVADRAPEGAARPGDLATRPGDAAARPGDLATRAAELAGDRYRLAVTAAGRGSIDRALEVLAGAGVPPIPEELLVESRLVEGFVFDPGRVAVIGEDDLFGRRRVAHETPKLTGRSAGAFAAQELSTGDFVVHRVHGVGRYLGMVHRRIADTERDYLLLEYAAGDRLYVPADQLDAVAKYIGGDQPRLHRLGSSDWVRATGRVRRAVRDMAGELVRLYTARMAAPGHRFGPDTPWQHELEDAFPYQETPDQLTVVAEVRRDMEEPKPMDRLICGDVGFGKTEIAVRAAFKAVMDGKQVAVLVPTTLLAEQHHVTFSERFAPFPVTVAMLSRFLNPAEQKRVLEEVAAGRVDVLIGTHRLLSSDVRFKDLGLLIVDEEQRFGVAHKERLKRLRLNVDVLTMTATPIPRTLEMALSGVRDLSVVDTPPEDRQPVLTYVGPYEEETGLGAVRRELRRGGQVFWVHNDVRTIDRRAGRIAERVPEARVAVAHGQMDEALLEKGMFGFWNQETDVLVCSTIIESGLDVPSANTLVIERADRMGLSQLYQLRGRVGRSPERAFAYLFFPATRRMTEEAHERLAAISRFTALGSGFHIAMRDLEIRGAGNLLGAEQHGHISSVGFDTYCRILAESVAEMKGQPLPEERDIRIDLPVRAFLPLDYLGQESLRIELYRRMASARSDEELDRVRDEAEDRFGPLPEEAVTLLEVSRLRALCRRLGINEVTTFRGQVRLRPIDLPEGVPLPEEASYHRTTRTLNFDPKPAETGPGLPGWIRARLEAVTASLEVAR